MPAAREQPPAGVKPPGRRMRITFTVTASQLAQAMVLAIRDDETIAYGDIQAAAAAVNQMSQAAADQALRDALWAYGALSWPDLDAWLEPAARAARARVDAWHGT